MISLFKKNRYKLIFKSKLSRYLVYAIGEILLIVIGILIALQINNWNSNKQSRKQELKIYQNIKSQVKEDLNELEKVEEINANFLEKFEKANRYILTNNRRAIDTLAFYTMALSQFSDFQRSSNIYEILVNSGDIKIMRNDSIVNKLQKLEISYNFINRLEDIHWELITTELSPEIKGVLNYTTFKIVKPEKLYSIEIQNLFFEFINLMKIKRDVYHSVIEDLNHILKTIDEEIVQLP
ncbi:DUF6090 family protein [Mangrovimonas sp. TPBH4]|uniref:DUF6090 family protein n=1 Tax=Mangrovimonas sp. TPBH4 TaxID=1645914 RepID=UPI0006B5B7AA|nr:DUF6090 family protein [Mangrovimonas sp. TPBH4]